MTGNQWISLSLNTMLWSFPFKDRIIRSNASIIVTIDSADADFEKYNGFHLYFKDMAVVRHKNNKRLETTSQALRMSRDLRLDSHINEITPNPTLHQLVLGLYYYRILENHVFSMILERIPDSINLP